MPVAQKSSDSSPDVRRLMFEASRRAEAMGLVEPPALGATSSADASAVRLLANRVRRAGIAAAAADQLHNVKTPSAEDVAGLLRTLIAALEASPVPKFEWGGLGRVFGPEDLATLINVSVSSLKRYQSGERDTPDEVAARLHFLALVVSDLAGSYNDIGIRRWFHRKRSLLDGRAPVALMKGNWDPDDEGPMHVRQLARELLSLSAT
ncbi:MAG TPA: hypothetical protein VGQ16_03960 [Vicinamibacterales bacterium]|nr:hypothetical protein [Vicinamibacterales bacterium]